MYSFVNTLFRYFFKRVFSDLVSRVIITLTDTVSMEVYSMNDSFFQLPDNKRNKIINAGFRVFSQYTYKKSPMGEIAAEAGISKSCCFTISEIKKSCIFTFADTALKSHSKLLSIRTAMITKISSMYFSAVSESRCS